MAIKEILQSLGLINLLPNFERERITAKEVPGLSESQLINLGVSTIGDRQRLRNNCKQTASVFRRFYPAKQCPYPKKGGKSKTTSWTKRLVCLADPETKSTPRSDEKQLLVDAGLGERSVSVPDINMQPLEFAEVLYTHFPKLKDAGGFVLLMCMGNDRSLVKVKGEYSPRNLKARTGQSRIYIRPVQHPLSLDSVHDVVDENSGLTQKCPKCGEHIQFDVLKKHIERCDRPSPSSTQTAEQKDETDDLYDPELEQPQLPGTSQPSTSQPSTSQPSTSSDFQVRKSTYNAYVDLLTESENEDDAALMRAISESLAFQQPGATSDTQTLGLKDVLKNYQQNSTNEKITIIVNRRRFLRSMLHAFTQPGFDCHKSVIVEFAGEEAIDIGGPKREMFRLLMKAVSDSMGVLEGEQGWQCFTHNVELLEENKYTVAGSFVAWSVLHGGPGLPTLHPELFKLMCGIKSAGFSDVSIVNDVDIRLKISKIASCNTAEEYSAVSLELAEWAAEQGVMSLYNSEFAKRDTVVASLLKHYCFYRTQSEIHQFIEGLGALWGIVKEFPNQLMPLFTSEGNEALTRVVLKSIMKVTYSEEGSNLRMGEDDTIFCWEVFLKDCEDGKTRTSLNDILVFISGADEIPPMGFDHDINVTFFSRNLNGRGHPTASTCALELYLPRGIEEPLFLRTLVEEAILDGKGFGKL